MSDVRARRMIVLEQGAFGERATEDYIDRGYGVILIPDLSRIPRSSADYFLTVTADTIQEFLKDHQEVILLEKKRARWTPLLSKILAKRNVTVQKRQLD